MKLTAEELAKVAHLSRLDWSEQAATTMRDSLDTILTYMETLNEVDTAEVAPTVHAVELRNVWREDEPHESLAHEAALQNAPERNEEYFKVPKVI